MIKTKRAYESPKETDGLRILIDRLWPRGLTKERAKINLWLKDIASSDALRKWFAHDPKKWEEFRKRYFQELNGKKEILKMIKEKMKEETVTLVYEAKDMEYNNAVVLKEYLNKSRS